MMPSTELRNALPSAWVDRLFMRFSTLYGKHWADMWDGVPMADVKDAWATELAGVPTEQIGIALREVGKFPPTLPEFVALCKPPAMPKAHAMLLPDRRQREPINEAVQREISELLRAGRKRDPKDWARQLLAQHERGERLLPIQVEFAREALGL